MSDPVIFFAYICLKIKLSFVYFCYTTSHEKALIYYAMVLCKECLIEIIVYRLLLNGLNLLFPIGMLAGTRGGGGIFEVADACCTGAL